MTGIPKGIPYIISNEASERFSYYGMRTILIIFMTRYLLDPSGAFTPMGEAEAKYYFHLFTSAVYFFPLFGALLSDCLLGKYRTIILLSVIYCLGHVALAIDHTRLGLAVGLTLISIGSGGIKPCVSAHVGDQFSSTNQHHMEKIFSWFYFAINLGAFVSTILTPILLEFHSPDIAFGVPGVLMLIATFVFWMGRYRFVHIPPGGKAFVGELFSTEGLRSLGKLSVLFLFVSVFWSLYDQTGSSWVLQAGKMDRVILGYEILPSQIQAVNPVLIMIFIPLFTYVIYPFIGRFTQPTPLKKISIGFFMAVPAFGISAWIESIISSGYCPGILWQVLSYVLITASEVMVSITCLEFSYTQAPRKLKSIIMALFLLSVSLGNAFTSCINYLMQWKDF